MRTFTEYMEAMLNEGKLAAKCPKCGHAMSPHPHAEKAKMGYKYCHHCGTTKSPEAQTPYKGSWADTVNKKQA